VWSGEWLSLVVTGAELCHPVPCGDSIRLPLSVPDPGWGRLIEIRCPPAFVMGFIEENDLGSCTGEPLA
jgi:hypothetical protein